MNSCSPFIEAGGESLILVADDNHADRLLLTALLRREGYSVVEAVDGVDALRQYQVHRPQLILLDALMPGMDGFEVAHQIKERAGELFTPIIFLTSLNQADELARCIEAGGDDFLSKPYNRILLKAKINALIRVRAMHVTMQSQRDEIRRHHARLVQDQQAAKAVFDGVLHNDALKADYLRSVVSPLSVFNGDLLLASTTPSGSLYVLLGDFTGHGLAAAIGALPLAETFYGMTRKGFAITDILSEANSKLHKILPVGYFCCAIAAELNFSKRTLELWNGGLPAAHLLRTERNMDILTSNHLALGILSPIRFDTSTQVYEMAENDRLLLCTDGIIEARNPAGEAFGVASLEALTVPTHLTEGLLEKVHTRLQAHIAGQTRDDDFTLVEVIMTNFVNVPLVNEAPPAASLKPVHRQDWSLTYELRSESLRSMNPIPLLQHVLMECEPLRAKVGQLQAVLTELYSNALEHGILGLDSSLKRSSAGFSQYYRLRAKALKNIDGLIRIEFQNRVFETGGELTIRVTDSGPGFDYANIPSPRSDSRGPRFHGRGLRLLEEMCRSVRFIGCGNQVEVILAW